MVPSSADREDALALDFQRYYRLVLPEDADKPFLSPHPLTWAPISHIIWDGLPPDALSVSHQQAMLDWLHWGGQIVLIGGAGPTFSIFRDSFLARYLPAEPTGESQLLGEAELKPLADAYPPPVLPSLPPEPEQDKAARRSSRRRTSRRAGRTEARADPAAQEPPGLRRRACGRRPGASTIPWARAVPTCWPSRGGWAAGGSRC